MAAVTDNALFRFLSVTDIGYFPRARYHYRERPMGCSTAILLYCREGKGSISLRGNDPVILEAGQTFFIPPNTPHWYSASRDMPWSVYWVHMKGELVSPFLELTGEGQPLDVSPQYEGDLLRAFYLCFDLLKSPYQVEEYFLVCQSAGEILALLAMAAKSSRQQLTKKGEEAIETCIRYMKANLSRCLSLEQLAEVSRFSASYLNVLFKQATGQTPVEYFLRMKMQAASKELYFTQHPIKEIALDFGIRDPYYFSRLFKKVMGVSPTAYRKQAIG